MATSTFQPSVKLFTKNIGRKMSTCFVKICSKYWLVILKHFITYFCRFCVVLNLFQTSSKQKNTNCKINFYWRRILFTLWRIFQKRLVNNLWHVSHKTISEYINFSSHFATSKVQNILILQNFNHLFEDGFYSNAVKSLLSL